MSIDKNTIIYLMTDERQEGFYDGLTKYYPNLFQFKDFPELRKLRHSNVGEAPPNNYLLFLIEARIYHYAEIKFAAIKFKVNNQFKEYYPFRQFVIVFRKKHIKRIGLRIVKRIDKLIGKSLIRNTYYWFRSI